MPQGKTKVSKRPGRYNSSLKQAAVQLEQQAAALAIIEKEVHWVQEREKVRERTVLTLQIVMAVLKAGW